MKVLELQIEEKGNVLKLLKQDEMALNKVVDDLADVSLSEWIRLANEGLHSTYREYVAGLQTPESLKKTGRGESSVSLIGWLPNAVENGLASFDMKPGFLKSSLAKTSKEGKRYLRIPMKGQGSARFRQRKRTAMGVNIRTASENSSSASWIHPGIEPRRFAEKVVEYASGVFDDMIDRELKNKR